jgi:hypothetical protein
VGTLYGNRQINDDVLIDLATESKKARMTKTAFYYFLRAQKISISQPRINRVWDNIK